MRYDHGISDTLVQPGSILLKTVFLLSACVAWIGMFAACAVAQDPAPAANPTKPFAPPRVPEILAPGVRPDVYYLRNEQGEEIAVPRARYEEYERVLLDASAEMADPGVPPVISQLDLVIVPESDFARVSVEASVRLTNPSKTWQSVPIALGQLQWIPSTRADATAEASEASIPELVAQSNGYLWRIEPGPARERAFKLDAVCKLTSSSNGYSMRLDLPSAATVIRLRLPQGDWELTASGGGNEVVEPFRTIDEESVAVVRTTANSVNLSWNRKAEREAIAAVEATSTTKFSPSDDGSQLKAITTLSLRGPTSLAGKRFTITLPSNSQLRETASTSIGFPGYRVLRNTPESDTPIAPSDGPVALEIEIEETLARSDLDIPLEWQVVGPPNPERIAFLAPIISGIQRHTGSFECLVPRAIVFDWDPIGETRLVSQAASADSSSSLIYSFQFNQQPAGVESTWQSMANRPRLNSLHAVDIQVNQVVLNGGIDFLSDPLQLPLLQLDLAGWNINRIVVHPSKMEIDPNTAQRNSETGNLAVPINASYWMSNTSDPPSTAPAAVSFRLEYVLSKPLDRDSPTLSVALPQLSWLTKETQQRTTRTVAGTAKFHSWTYRLIEQENASPSGMVAITEADPKSDATTALPPSTFSPFVLAYQVNESGTPVQWLGTRERRPSSTSAVYDATAVIADDEIALTHRWTCRSYGGRPTSIRLGVPKSTTEPTATTILKSIQVEGRDILAAKIDPTPGTVDDRYDWYEIEIPTLALDASHRSEFLATATTVHPIQWTRSGQTQIDLPLPIIASTHGSDILLVDSAEMRPPHLANISCQYDAQDATSAPLALDPESPRWTCQLTKKGPPVGQEIQMESEWVQTILNAIYQRDRYVARFSTQREAIQLHIPSPLRNDLEILLDGKRVVATENPDAPDTLRVELRDQRDVRGSTPEQDSDEERTHVLEVFTLRPSPAGWLRKLKLITPKLTTETGSAPLVWQVLVPRTEHLVWSSEQLSPMYRWQWQDLFFARASDLSQRQLEASLGATMQPLVTQYQTNQYDLSTLTGSQSLSAWFIPRSLIWLPIAILVLLLSMSMNERSWMNRPWLWGILLVGLFVFSQWAWDLSILVVQTLLAALSIAVAYGLIRWILNRRARRRSIFVSRSTQPNSQIQARSSPALPAPALVESSSKDIATNTSSAQVLGDGT